MNHSKGLLRLKSGRRIKSREKILQGFSSDTAFYIYSMNGCLRSPMEKSSSICLLWEEDNLMIVYTSQLERRFSTDQPSMKKGSYRPAKDRKDITSLRSMERNSSNDLLWEAVLLLKINHLQLSNGKESFHRSSIEKSLPKTID